MTQAKARGKGRKRIWWKCPRLFRYWVNKHHFRFIACETILMKSHCHPLIPRCPSSCRTPDARGGLSALPENMPKKKIATRLANSSFLYHVDKVYMAPGMYPASTSPSKSRMERNPARFLMNTCRVPSRPNRNTWPDNHLRGPNWLVRILFERRDLLHALSAGPYYMVFRRPQCPCTWVDCPSWSWIARHWCQMRSHRSGHWQCSCGPVEK